MTLTRSSDINSDIRVSTSERYESISTGAEQKEYGPKQTSIPAFESSSPSCLFHNRASLLGAVKVGLDHIK